VDSGTLASLPSAEWGGRRAKLDGLFPNRRGLGMMGCSLLVGESHGCDSGSVSLPPATKFKENKI